MGTTQQKGYPGEGDCNAEDFFDFTADGDEFPTKNCGFNEVSGNNNAYTCHEMSYIPDLIGLGEYDSRRQADWKPDWKDVDWKPDRDKDADWQPGRYSCTANCPSMCQCTSDSFIWSDRANVCRGGSECP